HKIKIIIVQVIYELDCARPDIIDAFCCRHCSLTHLFPFCIGQNRAWCLFDKLLHSSLNSAVTFTQMDDITVIIPQYLNFNMAEVFYILFYIQTLVAKGAFGL